MNQSSVETVEEFLYREATYLDQADLESWIQLFTEDGTYWIFHISTMTVFSWKFANATSFILAHPHCNHPCNLLTL